MLTKIRGFCNKSQQITVAVKPLILFVVFSLSLTFSNSKYPGRSKKRYMAWYMGSGASNPEFLSSKFGNQEIRNADRGYLPGLMPFLRRL